jgi:DNA-binding Lrp family transcriptional regulator
MEATAGPPPLDAVDRALLAALRADGRQSMRELAARTGIARASAYTRVARLRDAGVITGFTAVVDPARAGRPLAAYIHLRVRQQAWKTLRERLLALDGVEHAAQVSGDFDVIVLVRTSGAAALRELVLERLQTMPEVRGTSTSMIFDEARG